MSYNRNAIFIYYLFFKWKSTTFALTKNKLKDSEFPLMAKIGC